MLLLDSVISLIAPHECVGCGTEGCLLCPACADDIVALPERCYICNRLTKNSAPCSSCRSGSNLRYAWVRTVYAESAQALLARLKFNRAIAGASVIAELMADVIPYYAPDTIISHVPTATSRIRQRGYDQSQLIAQYLAKHLGCTYRPLLFRSGNARQVGSSRSERIRHMETAYAPRCVPQTKGRTVLLVDDVLTTGASIEAAARTIRNMGALHVDAAVFAQKQ